jgi:hypothetical protein
MIEMIDGLPLIDAKKLRDLPEIESVLFKGHGNSLPQCRHEQGASLVFIFRKLPGLIPNYATRVFFLKWTSPGEGPAEKRFSKEHG